MQYLIIAVLAAIIAAETLTLAVVYWRKRTWKRRAIAASPTVWGSVRQLYIDQLRDVERTDWPERFDEKK